MLEQCWRPLEIKVDATHCCWDFWRWNLVLQSLESHEKPNWSLLRSVFCYVFPNWFFVSCFCVSPAPNKRIFSHMIRCCKICFYSHVSMQCGFQPMDACRMPISSLWGWRVTPKRRAATSSIAAKYNTVRGVLKTMAYRSWTSAQKEQGASEKWSKVTIFPRVKIGPYQVFLLKVPQTHLVEGP